jgi:L-fuconate dehydratase
MFKIREAAYAVPETPGYSADIHPESLDRHRFPDGKAWQ